MIYSPEYGTTVSEGSRQLIAKPGDALINAVLDIALLHSGISIELRRQLLQGARLGAVILQKCVAAMT